MKKLCIRCNKEFHVKPSHAKFRSRCSVACKALDMIGKKNKSCSEERKRKIGLANARPKVKSYCKECNKEFYTRPSFKGVIKHCSSTCATVTRKKFIPWNKGRKGVFSEETIQKMRVSASGKFGKLSSNWQGGKTSLSLLVRNSEMYNEWRKAVFVKDSYTCQKCNFAGVYLEAHHIKPFVGIMNTFLELYDQFSPMEDKETLVRLAIKYEPFWTIDNGKTLCTKCHNKTKGIINAH